MSKLGTKVNLLNLINGSCEKPTANIILRDQQQGNDVFYLTFTEDPSQCNKTSKRNKMHANGKGKSEVSVIADDMI